MARKSKKRVEVSDDEGGDHAGGSSSAAVASTRPSKLPEDLIPAYDAVVREFTSTMMVRCVCNVNKHCASGMHSNAHGRVQHFFTAHDRSLILQTRPIFSRYGAIYALCQILERVLPAGARRTELESHVALKWVASRPPRNHPCSAPRLPVYYRCFPSLLRVVCPCTCASTCTCACARFSISSPRLPGCRHVVASANDNVRPYGFAIQEARTEGDGKLYYVLANTVRSLVLAWRGVQQGAQWSRVAQPVCPSLLSLLSSAEVLFCHECSRRTR